MTCRLLVTSLASLCLLACGDGTAPPVRCGPGTELVGDTCVISPIDAGVSPDADRTVDAGETADPDAGEPDRCRGSDVAICEGEEVVDCATGQRTTCSEPDSCQLLLRADGSREGFCAPRGVTPCDPEAIADRCDGSVLRTCLRRVEVDGHVLPGWQIERDCGAVGPGAACVAAPTPHCALTPCDVATTPTRCEPDGRALACGADGLSWWECGGGAACRPDRTRRDVVCVPPGAAPGMRGSILEESVACAGASVRRQHGGYEWVEPCEDALIRIDGEFRSVPTSCVSRDGLAYCLPDATYRAACSGTGWSCSGDVANYCNAGVTEWYGCAVGCDPDTARCVAPLACDPSMPSGVCLDPVLAAACSDEDGDGNGFITRVACVGGCGESGGFDCR